MVDELEKNPQLDGVFCNSSVVDSHLQKLNYSLWKMRNFTRKMQTELSNGNSLKVFLKRVTLSAHNIAFRRRALNYIFPIPEITPFYLDTWIGLCIALFSNWAMIDEELTDYRVHENNESSPKMAGIITQVILSKKARSKNSIAATVKLADDLLEISQGKVSNEKLNSLKNFKTHYVVRNNYSHFFVIRVVQVLFELLSFRYKYYSNGWKSIAADIILFK